MTNTIRVATVTLNPAIDQTVTIPNFTAGAVNRVEKSQSDAGGKGVNVASFLSDFELPVSVTGFLGAENAQIFERLFAQKQIEDRFVRIAGSTRTGIKIADSVSHETTDINFPGQAPNEQNIESLFETVTALTETCDWFVLAGSIPAGMRTSIYRELVEVIKANGKAVALDTSGTSLKEALPAGPTLVKPNIHELEDYLGQKLESQSAVIFAAQDLLDDGIETVVVSMGADGALFVEADEILQVIPPKITVKSTVGAGDAMVSGTVAGKIKGLPLATCARLGTAFSLVAISHIGAGLPSLPEVEAFQQQVTIKKIASNNG